MPNTPRLDRLSALLAGLEPRVEVLPTAAHDVAASAGALLHLHLIASGRVHWRWGEAPPVAVDGPALIICRADTAHAVTLAAGAPTASVMSARAHLDGPLGALFLKEFAHPVTIDPSHGDASLSHVLALIASELAERRCGHPALLNRAGDILFIAILRHLVANAQQTAGLFSGLADARIARVLVALHTAPQMPWTLESMADEAAMSRTAFTVRFRDVMATPPGKYLGNLRLSIARRAVESGLGLKTAARNAGYHSPSALSRALSKKTARLQAN